MKGAQSMNKTVLGKSVDALREEEKAMSLKIYKNLHLLTKYCDPTNEFLNILAQDMFVKSNPKAFNHVMHFLFMSLDPIEFKKRFYWPLDKNTENSFRSGTVQYINELILKYDLNMEPVGSYIVVLPGGKKFMKVLIPIIRVVMIEELKKKCPNFEIVDVRKQRFTKEYMNNRTLEHSIWVNSYTHYTTIMDKETENLQIAIDKLRTIRNRIIMNNNLEFIFKKHNNNLLKIHEELKIEIELKLSKINSSNNLMKQLATDIKTLKELFQTKIIDSDSKYVKIDQDELKQTITILCNKNPNLFDKLKTVYVNGKINLGNMIEIIIHYLPIIFENTNIYSEINLNQLVLHSNGLSSLLTHLNKLKCSAILLNRQFLCFKEDDLYNSVLLDSMINESNINNILSRSPKIKWAISNDASEINLGNSLLMSIKKKNPLRSVDSLTRNKPNSSFNMSTVRLSENNKGAKPKTKIVATKFQLNNLIGLTSKWHEAEKNRCNDNVNVENNMLLSDTDLISSNLFLEPILKPSTSVLLPRMLILDDDFPKLSPHKTDIPQICVSNASDEKPSFDDDADNQDFHKYRNENSSSDDDTVFMPQCTIKKNYSSDGINSTIKYNSIETIDLTIDSGKKSSEPPQNYEENLENLQNLPNIFNKILTIKSNESCSTIDLIDVSDTCLNDISI